MLWIPSSEPCLILAPLPHMSGEPQSMSDSTWRTFWLDLLTLIKKNICLYPLNVTKHYMLDGPFFVFMFTFVSVTKSLLLHQSAKQHYKHTTQVVKAYLPNVTLIMFEIHSEPWLGFKKQNKMSPSTQCTFGSRKASLYFWAGILPTLLKMFVYGVSKLSNDVVT